ncbi:MAG: SUMF1/EgtB/PvdO family nonheme iron enzyme, partial [Polyangiaceae bacterium]|nr:SUMF1/EgtB/PvdO family nonheme iron enzyme [Polyangiaceae bacterium]
EWTADWYDDYPTDAQTDPLNYSSGSFRVLRGGNFIFLATLLRSAQRYYYPPAARVYDRGFRCARTR